MEMDDDEDEDGSMERCCADNRKLLPTGSVCQPPHVILFLPQALMFCRSDHTPRASLGRNFFPSRQHHHRPLNPPQTQRKRAIP